MAMPIKNHLMPSLVPLLIAAFYPRLNRPRYNAGMVISLTLRCDSGCPAATAIENRADAELHGWRVEWPGLYSLHLCPEHSRHSWHKVREQAGRIESPTTPR